MGVGRVPTAGRNQRYDDDEPNEQASDQEEDEKPSKKKKKGNFLGSARARLTAHLVETATEPAMGRPPKTEDEKRQSFKQLALLRSANITYEDCALKLGVSRSTIGAWMADPLYKEVCETIQQDGKMQGFVSVGTLVQDAIATMYHLMQTDPSGFVRFKSAEYLLKVAGMEVPPQQAVADDKTAVNQFLDQVRARSLEPQSRVNVVNVNVNVTSDGSQSDILAQAQVVDALPPEEETPQPQEITMGTVVIGSLLPESDYRVLSNQQRSMFNEYSEPLLPGGKLPGSEHPLVQLQKRQAAPKRQDDD